MASATPTKGPPANGAPQTPTAVNGSDAKGAGPLTPAAAASNLAPQTPTNQTTGMCVCCKKKPSVYVTSKTQNECAECGAVNRRRCLETRCKRGNVKHTIGGMKSVNQCKKCKSANSKLVGARCSCCENLRQTHPFKTVGPIVDECEKCVELPYARCAGYDDKDGVAQQCRSPKAAELKAVDMRSAHRCKECDGFVRSVGKFYGERPPQAEWAKALFDGRRADAKAKRIPFTIVMADMPVIDKCEICQVLLVKGAGGTSDQSATLDKVKPALGYVKGNLAILCNKHNRMKNDGDANDTLQICLWMLQREGKDPIAAMTECLAAQQKAAAATAAAAGLFG